MTTLKGLTIVTCNGAGRSRNGRQPACGRQHCGQARGSRNFVSSRDEAPQKVVHVEPLP
jgi:hypothetical protein